MPNPLAAGLGIRRKPDPCAVVVFGASGDLTKRKLFPALYALERDGKLRCEERPSENNRPARFYALTTLGRKELERAEQRWERVTAAISSVLQNA